MLEQPTRATGPSILLLAALLSTGCPDGGGGGGTTAGSSSGTEASTSLADTTAGQNQAPPMPTLVSPADGASDVPIQSELCWELVDDPDGDPVRYRVFVDDIELAEGKLGDEGHAGPCIGPLALNYDQVYAWQVQAFDPDEPGLESARTPAWTFHTAPDGLTTTVFEDPFDEDLGWELSGDALDGSWVRGNPVPATHLGWTSQPAGCAGGQSCVFTGQNPQGLPWEADVAGGSTTLTSPAFDLGGFAAATVTLSRFFYKSSFPETGTLFRVELLVPDDAVPGGEQVFVLEQLELAEDGGGRTNTWTPVEYAACNLPMVDGSRLRLVATDLGAGVLEAAVDSVVVTGQLQVGVCDGGEGAICDPNADAPCEGELLCCARGTVNKGVYRCAQAVPSITYPEPGGPVGTMNGPLGCDAPDLFVESEGIDVYEDDQFFLDNSCEILEGCVPEPGWRRLLRFDTRTPNAGSRDLALGVPSNHPDLFHWSECHGHYHFDGYAYYDLLDGMGNVVATGHKQAFCLLDWSPWAWNDFGGDYTCSNQGISLGWEDVYGSYLDCQYVDITDVPPGDYVLRVSVNQPLPEAAVAPLIERDYDNNVLEVPVTITGM
ncbi:lysyl oxidase family protein [Paraliomyxa miuraensis]|uniref:lysyl oxidase family protein n=1 Tax=Paraliomyxa miuraensis TaxID=376150 RepID=UPI002257BFCE|nr:lysyl oxidase family protein [Paraliomyxa miuraensis]MCX4242765.1 lysyl oxidase family protein [Paraliomyxa miuraensis]